MRTTVLYYKQKTALRDYFARLTADTRCMRNTACFYIRVIPVYGKEDEKPSFSGKRVKRGLYQSADGTCLNADVNGSGNILRKQYPDAFAEKNLSYLWRTTRSVNISSLYVPYRTGRKHKCRQSGISSRLHHKARKQMRLQLPETFQARKKIWQPERTAV